MKKLVYTPLYTFFTFMDTPSNLVFDKKTAFDKLSYRTEASLFLEKISKNISTTTEFQRLLSRVKVSDALRTNENVLVALKTFTSWVEGIGLEQPRPVIWNKKIAPLKETIAREETLMKNTSQSQVGSVATRVSSELPINPTKKLHYASKKMLENNVALIIEHFTSKQEVPLSQFIGFLRSLGIQSIRLEDNSVEGIEDKKSHLWVELATILQKKGYKLTLNSKRGGLPYINVSKLHTSITPERPTLEVPYREIPSPGGVNGLTGNVYLSVGESISPLSTGNTAYTHEEIKRMTISAERIKESLLVQFTVHADSLTGSKGLSIDFWHFFSESTQEEKSFVSPRRGKILALLDSFFKENGIIVYLKISPSTLVFHRKNMS